jgi:mono/diheme cytochrome c family protein
MVSRRSFICVILLLLFQLLPGCDYARMKDQESVRTYEAQPPEMPVQSVPVSGGVAQLRNADPQKMKNALPVTDEVIARGKTSYEYFCAMCHGPEADGKGTVGQSFAPLPTDLRGAYVRGQSDGLLFYRISLGFNRHPSLFGTVSSDDRWAVIRYLRSLREEKS